MFSENLKTLRKMKGFTQEELAIKVNVVRQTVSKWEKGLSVPDAELLSQLADVLEVDVSQLLGAEIKEDPNRNEVAEQLAKISEQMAIKNRRARRIWKVIGLILIIGLIITILGAVLFSANTSTATHSEGPVVVIDETNE